LRPEGSGKAVGAVVRITWTRKWANLSPEKNDK